MTSYAQNFEDVMLARALHEVEQGFYVDVGANDPDISTVTRHFYESGWNGINIEPGTIFTKLAQVRTRDVNLNIAVSDHAGTATLFEYPDAPLLNSLEVQVTPEMEAHAAGRTQRDVRTQSLRDILSQHAQNRVIDFLNIDVEGHEATVLKSNDWERFRPRIVVVEATEPMSPHPTHEAWEPILIDARYVFAYFDGLNRFYVRLEDAERLPSFNLPANVFDDFKLGPNDALKAQLAQCQASNLEWQERFAVLSTRLALAEASNTEWQRRDTELRVQLEVLQAAQAAVRQPVSHAGT